MCDYTFSRQETTEGEEEENRTALQNSFREEEERQTGRRQRSKVKHLFSHCVSVCVCVCVSYQLTLGVQPLL